MITASRSHEFSYGHRVVGHEGKCKNLHGHNAKVIFHVEANKLDSVGRVIDFSVIKEKLCQWLEDNWDHKTLLWNKDSLIMGALASSFGKNHEERDKTLGLVWLQFNPTAENLASYLLRFVGPLVLADLEVRLVVVEFFETSKCSVAVGLDDALEG